MLIEEKTSGWTSIYGVGPIDALMNAMMLVRELFRELNPAPRGGARQRARDAADRTTKR